MATRTGKVLRLNFKNTQYIDDVRKLFAKVKFFENVYWDDNRILTMALTNLIIDFRTYTTEEEKLKAIKAQEEIGVKIESGICNKCKETK